MKKYFVLIKGDDKFRTTIEVEANNVMEANDKVTSVMISLAKTTIEELHITGIIEDGKFSFNTER